MVGRTKLGLGTCTCTIPVQIPDEEKPLDNGRNDVAPFHHRADPHVAAREVLRNGTDNVVPDHVPDRPNMLRGQRVLVHERVHGGINICRRSRSQRA